MGNRATDHLFGGAAALVGLAMLAGTAAGQLQAPPAPGIESNTPTVPHFVIKERARLATVYATGEVTMLPCETVWKPCCFNTPGTMTVEDLKLMAARHGADFADPARITVVNNGNNTGRAINIVYVLGAGVPAAAVPAFAAAEAYIESRFSDPITVTIAVSFASLGPGILGGTSSTYGYVSYAGSRTGLTTGADANDTIQAFLPTTSTVPVRYNGSSATVTNETRVFWTIANYNATVGAAAGNAASMQFSTNFPFDYDPSNGITANTYSFQDVIIHETGHALGFTSGADFRTNDLETLDLFRFQRTDGSADYNPDTTAEFQVRPRLVSYNKPNDDHNCDIISAEYRMSDGSPYQCSHFLEQTPAIGLMDPALGYGQTFYPGYFTTADLTMFDAIGYDR